MQHHPELDRWIIDAVGRKTGSVLDLGCGIGRNGYLMWERGMAPRRVGIEVDQCYLEKALELGVYERVEQADLSRGIPEDDKSFDVVLCTQVIALMKKSAGVRLLDDCERVAVQRVVLTVQVGTPQLEVRPNPHESDRSQWTAGELRERGYSVRGFGSRLSRNIHGGRRFLYGFYVGTLLAQLSTRYAEEVLAVRELSPPPPETGGA